MKKFWIAVHLHNNEIDVWPIFCKEEMERELENKNEYEHLEIRGPFLLSEEGEED